MRKLTKLKVQKNCRKVIVELVVILTGAKSLEDLKHLFGLFCIILLNKKKNKTVKDALKEIKCMSDNSFINYDDSKQISQGHTRVDASKMLLSRSVSIRRNPPTQSRE